MFSHLEKLPRKNFVPEKFSEKQFYFSFSLKKLLKEKKFLIVYRKITLQNYLPRFPSENYPQKR